MYKLNEEKIFADNVDDQLVVLHMDTGSYYTFNDQAAAIIRDLDAGYSAEEICSILHLSEEEKKQLGELINQGLISDILIETAEKPDERPEARCRDMNRECEVFCPEMVRYDDLEAYFLVDPIHEVDPNIGWSMGKEDEE